EVGRVICRPFQGTEGNYKRTERRKDFPVTPPPTVLDDLQASGSTVHAIGKIYEIFNGRGISTWAHTTNNPDHISALQTATESDSTPLICHNGEDWDRLEGMGNDQKGIAPALEPWHAPLPSLQAPLRPGAMMIITADHGNDPTAPSTDHSREYPFLLA